MLLIGFSWVLIGTVAGVVAKLLIPGRWEDAGPVAMMTATLGAFLGGGVAVLAVEGPRGYGPPTMAGWELGLIGSLIGGAIGFAVYAVDARRTARA